MLTLIRVKNYAVIDEVEVEFAPGLSVMTGETGAGKSILVDALGLLLGDRADAGVVRQGAERAEISAAFECPPQHATLAWLRDRGFDDGDGCTLRRLIGAEGRSRAFINGQPANLQDLKAVGSLLIDIHGQHAHQSLLDAGNQRDLLDAHAGLVGLAADVGAAHARWQKLAAKLIERRAASTDRTAELELLRFQTAELEALNLGVGEAVALRQERDRLANTDRLIGGVTGALERLAEGELSAYRAVVQAQQDVARLAEHDQELRGTAEQLASVEIELREIESTLARYRERIEADPARLEWLEERLAKIRKLARRHAVADDDLHGILPVLKERIAGLDGGAEALEAMAGESDRARAEFFGLAATLSAGRARHAKTLSRQVTAELVELGMPHGEFRVELHPKGEGRADAAGLERVEFQVRMNPGQAYGALTRVASGGELSRISLAIEVVRSGASPVPSFVFDEVDAGVGGRVAEIVGRKLRQLAAERQVLCVTHLPQVASQGEHHYRVVKLTDGKISRTQVRPLSAEERVEELSRMLGGIEITERTRAHAAEMMDRAAR